MVSAPLGKSKEKVFVSVDITNFFLNVHSHYDNDLIKL